MRLITTPPATIKELLDKFGYVPPVQAVRPVKHEAHVYTQSIGEWMNGCNAHIEEYFDHMEASGYDGIELPSQYLDQW